MKNQRFSPQGGWQFPSAWRRAVVFLVALCRNFVMNRVRWPDVPCSLGAYLSLHRVRWPDVPCSLGIAGLGFLLCLFWPVGGLQAHPAHATPVKYPFVVGFERFYTDLDTPEHLARGGLLLLNELNCVACHAPPARLAPFLTGKTGTRLAGVGSRFEELDLEMMIRSPRFVKTDTTMPTLFSGPDRDLEEIEALKHFLGSLKEPRLAFPKGDIERGRVLYHQVGCVACHAPEVDYRPPWIPENVELNLASLPSVPMNLADRYPREALTDLILDPVKHRPSGRMPRFELSREEAVDIGAYLNAAPRPEISGPLAAALAKAAPFEPEPALIERGRVLFGKKNCVACHAGVTGDSPVFSKPLEELKYHFSEDPAALNAQPRGCLSERPPGQGIPAFGLDNLQKRAISLALESLGEMKIETPAERIDWVFSTQNCHACHDRDGKGGTESARSVFFTVTDPDALPLGLSATHPPGLDGVGLRLTEEWWGRVVFGQGGSGAARDHMAARMPVFRPQDLGGLDFSLFRSVDAVPKLVAPPAGDAARGQRLIGLDGKNCVACHGVGDLQPPEARSISLNFAARRLNPKFFAILGETQNSPLEVRNFLPAHQFSLAEAADLWAYLQKPDAFPPPKGLLLPDVTELKPEKTTLAVRGPFADRSEDALLIGFPGGWNLAFDRVHCRWIALWKGRFTDPGNGEGEPVVLQPLGVDMPLPNGWQAPGATAFLGHGFDPGQSVTLRYRSEGDFYEDQVWPDGRRAVRKNGRAEAEERMFEQGANDAGAH